MAFITDTINNYLNSIVSGAMSTAGGVAGDVVGGVGNSINGVGRAVEGHIRYYGDGARDYGNAIKDWTGAPGMREATATNPLGLTDTSSGGKNSLSWNKGGGSSIRKAIDSANSVTKPKMQATSIQTPAGRKALPAPARQKALPAPKPAPVANRSAATTAKKPPPVTGPTKTITVGGVTKKMPVYKDGKRVGAAGKTNAPATTAALGNGSAAQSGGRKKPSKQAIMRKERARQGK